MRRGLGLSLGRRRRRGIATWTPASLGAALKFWVTAGPTWCFSDALGTVACGDGDAIYVWKDRSGAAYDLTQSTAAARPTLRTVGGAWFVRFDGTDDFMATADPLAGLELLGPMEAHINLDLATPAAGGLLLFKGLTTGATDCAFEFRTYGGAVQAKGDGGGAASAATAPDSTRRSYGFGRQGAPDSHFFFRDGAADGGPIAGGSPTASASPLRLGIRADSWGPLAADVRHAVILDGALAPTDRALLATYLAD